MYLYVCTVCCGGNLRTGRRVAGTVCSDAAGATAHVATATPPGVATGTRARAGGSCSFAVLRERVVRRVVFGRRASKSRSASAAWPPKLKTPRRAGAHSGHPHHQLHLLCLPVFLACVPCVSLIYLCVCGVLCGDGGVSLKIRGEIVDVSVLSVRVCARSRSRHARAAVVTLMIRGWSMSAPHAGASPHWEKLWAADGGLKPGTRFDVAGASLPLIAESKRRVLAPRGGMSALVPGCGRAYDAAFLAEHGFETVLALDISPTACNAARKEVDSMSSAAKARVAIECGDFFEEGDGRKFDFIWDCTFLCALEPDAREAWAKQMATLLADDGEILACVFPIGPREGGPPFAMSVDLVRSLLEPVGFVATMVRDDLPLEEQHRRPGDALDSVRTRGRHSCRGGGRRR